jgi:hypothetical protein
MLTAGLVDFSIMKIQHLKVFSILFATVSSAALPKEVHGKGSYNHNHTSLQSKLRGHTLEALQKPAGKPVASHHRVPAIVALQAGQTTHLQSTHTSHLRSSTKLQTSLSEQRIKRKAATRERSYFTHLLESLRRQVQKKQNIAMLHKHTVDLCNGNKYQWMVQARQGCKDSYGEDSVWQEEGACATAWTECNSDMAGDCCSQPEGPQNMNAYCASEEHREDRACAVQGDMEGVQSSMSGIRDAVGLLETRPPPPANPTLFTVTSGDCRLVEGGRCVVSPGWPEDYEDESECEIRAPMRGVIYPRVKLAPRMFNTESCCDKLTIGDRVYSGEGLEEAPDREIEGVTTMKWESDFSGSATGWKICAEDIPPPPPTPAPPMCLRDPSVLAADGSPSPGPSPAGSGAPAPAGPIWVPCPSPARMPEGLAPSPGPAPGPRKSNKYGPRKPTKLETQCQKLTDLVRKAAKQLDAVKRFAEHDGIVESNEAQGAHRTHTASLMATAVQVVFASSNPGTSEAKDPDLTFAMRRVLNAGSQLDMLRDSNFCSHAGQTSSLDDPDEDDDTEDYDDNATLTAEEEEEEEEEEINATLAATGEYDGKTNVNGSAITTLMSWETGMNKAVSGFEGEVHPHGRKWWRYRYEYTLVESLVLAFSVMLLYLFMYLLHGASFFGKFKFYNAGLTSRLFRYAWGYFVFHAAALMVMVTLGWMLYMPWGEGNIFDVCAKAFHEMVNGRFNVPFLGYSWLLMILDVQFQLFVTFALYAVFIIFVTCNIARALDDWRDIAENALPSSNRLKVNDMLYNDFQDILTSRIAKSDNFKRVFSNVKLRYHALGMEFDHQQGFHDFKLHLYLTDAFGKSLEYLVEVSLKANVFLACCALCFALLAHHYQVAFMYFLPIFIVLGIVIFSCSYIVSRTLRDNNHKHNLDSITVHAYCRSVQLVMYAIFFSFARLVLSSDIFIDYPRVYLSALVGLVVTLFLCWFMAGEVIKETVISLVLPHHTQEARFQMNLQHVAYWHTTENCHECGVRQAPVHASLSREWTGSKKDGAPGFDGNITSGRGFSFR